jgi:uncharacterized YceG family protein
MVLLLSPVFLSCVNLPKVDTPATHLKTVEPRETAEAQILAYEQGQLNQGREDIEKGEINLGLAKLVGLLSKEREFFCSLVALQTAHSEARAVIEQTAGRFRILPGIGWVKTDSGAFVPVDPDARELPLPSFSLAYELETTLAPVDGVSYRFEFVEGTGQAVSGGKTDSRGKGAAISMERTDPLHRASVRLFLKYQVGSFTHEFSEPVVLFTYPEPRFHVTVFNGERMADLLSRVVGEGFITEKSFLDVAAEVEFPEFPFVPPPKRQLSRFEGLFRPGIYSFLKHEILSGTGEAESAGAVRVLDRLLGASAEFFTDLDPAAGLNPYELIVLASIVEKEAVSDRDYDKVASVFLNRLAGGSRLASCPTVEYALGYHRPFLNGQDIAIDSPYNVYRYHGLPPTPICFFTEEALDAVRNPMESRLYYFVYDWTRGELRFSQSYDEHLENAKIARANYETKYGEDAIYRIDYGKYYED